MTRSDDDAIKDDNPLLRQSESDNPADESVTPPETLPTPSTETPPKEPEAATPSEPELTPSPITKPKPSPAEAPEEYLVFGGNQFNQLFLEANLENLASLQDVEPPVITGDEATDQRIRVLAEERGYRRRPEALDRSRLVFIEGTAFRSYDSQLQIFLGQVSTPYADEEVNEALRLRSIAGYSKHHTGYAIDISEGLLTFEDFADSASYAWLVADNYLNAKKYGWIPSYPPDARLQGPDPEAWKFTFVGKEYLLKTELNSGVQQLP